MVLGITLDEATERMGHKRSTRTRELVAALGDHAKDKRLIPIRQRPAPDFAILKVTWNGKPRRSHYVLRIFSYICDPEWPDFVTKYNWDRWLEGRGRVTSALELNS